MKTTAKKIFRNELETMGVYVPGKPIEEVKKEYGLDEVVKLASNENPLGPSPKAVENIIAKASQVNIYPDGAAMELRTTIAEKHGVNVENVVCGNGGEQILTMIAQAIINEGDNAIMADTTFGLYGSSVVHMGGKAINIPLKDYKHDVDKII